MAVFTHKVEVVPLVMEKHPNADRLSVVHVHAFTVVVNTQDWQGVDKAAYCQPDTVLPDKPEYAFLKRTPDILKAEQDTESDFAAGKLTQAQRDTRLAEIAEQSKKGLRLTVRKFRGVVSMGMLVPAPEGSQIGDNVAEILGTTHYDPALIGDRPEGYDLVPAPPLVYKPDYDVESVYQFDKVFEPGELVYVSEKVDGQNCRAAFVDGEQHVGSRNEWKNVTGDSNPARMLRHQPWVTEWCKAHAEHILYGEIFGWVAKLKYGAREGQIFFRAFDILNGQSYVDAEEFIHALPEEQRVPNLGIMSFDFEALKKLSNGKSLIPGANHLREGIVIRPVKERMDMTLGRVILKIVSTDYLEKSSR